MLVQVGHDASEQYREEPNELWIEDTAAIWALEHGYMELIRRASFPVEQPRAVVGKQMR